MNAGEFKHKITINRQVSTRGTAGALEKTKELLGIHKAGVKFLSGNETDVSQKQTARQKVRFKTRHIADLDEDCEIEWNGYTWNIDYIQPIGNTLLGGHLINAYRK